MGAEVAVIRLLDVGGFDRSTSIGTVCVSQEDVSGKTHPGKDCPPQLLRIRIGRFQSDGSGGGSDVGQSKL